MKKRLSILIAFSLLTTACLQERVTNRIVTKEDNSKMFIGEVTKEGFETEPFSTWFLEGYDGYEVDSTLLKPLKKNVNRYRYELFMGTWCGDSKREVPRVLKIMEAAKVAERRLRIYAVNRQKISFYGEEQQRNIVRVPTLIVYRGRKEVGRIIEYPVESWEKDLLKIFNEEEYIPNYFDAKRQ